MRGTVIKYYSVCSGSLEWCLRRLGEMEEKHPDRDYVILKNMRGYYSDKFSLVQRDELSVSLPTEAELQLPPPVPKPALVPPLTDQRTKDPRWIDYDRDQDRRKKYIAEAQEPVRKLLKTPLNQ